MNAKQVREYIDAVNPKMTTPTPKIQLPEYLCPITADEFMQLRLGDGTDPRELVSELWRDLAAAQEKNVVREVFLKKVLRKQHNILTLLATTQEALKATEQSDLAARITLDAQEKAALKGQADVLDALNTSQAHEIALLKTKLASVKAERDSLGTQLEQIAHERTP